MQKEILSSRPSVLILGMGGTIAGCASRVGDSRDYLAGELPVQALVDAVPGLAKLARLRAETVAQIDSKDMIPAVWSRLVAKVRAVQRDINIDGVVITHGTDTLEESAWLLERLVDCRVPVVLTAAMHPANARLADGPNNLFDAVTVAASQVDMARGVRVVMNGEIHTGRDIVKMHTLAVSAIESPNCGPLGYVGDGQIAFLRAPLPGKCLALEVPENGWPWVEIITSHGDARSAAVDALRVAGVRGLVVAGTGSGTIHAELLGALERAELEGIAIVRASRVPVGVTLPHGGRFACAGILTPAKARLALQLALLGGVSAQERNALQTWLD